MMKRGLIILLAMTLLSSCGFHLRGSTPLPNTLQTVQIEAGDAHGYLARQLANRLRVSGSQVVDKGPVVINLGKEGVSRRSIAYTPNARAAEFELVLQVNYWIDMRDPAVRIAENKIQIAKSYSYDPLNPSGKSEEENLLKQDMRREILDQLMRELYLLPNMETVKTRSSTQDSDSTTLPVQASP